MKTELVTEQQEMLQLEAEARGEMAEAIYEEQDAHTRLVIENVMDELRRSVSEEHRKALSEEEIEGNLMYLAIEILKGLALFDIQVAGFQFTNQCVNCGVEL